MQCDSCDNTECDLMNMQGVGMGKVIKLHVSTGWAGADHQEEVWNVPENWDSFTDND